MWHVNSRKSLVVLSALVLICLSSSGARSDQVAPDVSIECDDVIDSIDSSPSHPTRSVYFDCFVENPSTFTEEIRLQYSSSDLEVIGETMIVLGPGGSTTLQVQARANRSRGAVARGERSVRERCCKGASEGSYCRVGLLSEPRSACNAPAPQASGM